jgi:hypothetical protein
MRRKRPLRRRPQPVPTVRPEPAHGLASYANQFEVGYNAFEFLFDFGQDYAEGEHRGTAHARIVTVPAYAKVFLGVLDRSIGEYEALYGVIALPPQSPGVEPPAEGGSPWLEPEVR